MDIKDGETKQSDQPIHLFVGLVLAVVALVGAIYFYFHIPSPRVVAPQAAKVDFASLDRSGKDLVKQKKYDEAIIQFTQALALSPGNGTVLMDRGAAYYKMQNFQDALSDYQLVVSNCPPKQNELSADDPLKKASGDKAPSADQFTNALFGVALCQNALEQQPLAIKTLHDLQSRDSHFVKSYQLLGDIYLKTGDTEAALDAYTQGLRLNPESSDLHCDRAVAYLKRDMTAQAFDDLTKALDLEKGSLPMRLQHANLAQKLGKLKIADSDAQEILLIQSDNVSALDWLKKRKIPVVAPAPLADAKK